MATCGWRCCASCSLASHVSHNETSSIPQYCAPCAKPNPRERPTTPTRIGLFLLRLFLAAIFAFLLTTHCLPCGAVHVRLNHGAPTSGRPPPACVAMLYELEYNFRGEPKRAALV